MTVSDLIVPENTSIREHIEFEADRRVSIEIGCRLAFRSMGKPWETELTDTSLNSWYEIAPGGKSMYESISTEHWFARARSLCVHIPSKGQTTSASSSGSVTHWLVHARAVGLHQYLTKIARAGLISQETREQAIKVLNRLSEILSGSLSIPDACPGPNGHLLYTWDKNAHHLEVEFVPERRATLFYMNRSSGNVFELEIDEFDIPRSVLSTLRFFSER
jgi:hypothetical protein